MLLDIREIRDGLGLSQDEFAGALGVSVPTVSRWENGHSKPPRNVRRLLAAFQKASGKPGAADIIADALLLGGAAYLLYRILEVAFKKGE